ncbi:MAG TPA: lamin tail domain-containing protein [Dokdonella sp.]|uniref:lamin tail domain-containing protein n=1 Tax=Dokdonella sp. TaxID=2291710 RepID=UPI002D7ECAAC|nr:lamin tail domain-containing protein [Dokdonella sp.]HET9031817.1 lamin tail domain-containing protein [Dokdonella sp.]
MFRMTKTLIACVLFAATASSASAQIVISQVYGGGGNSGSTYTHDFIELFNAGSSPQDLTGWTVQYASSSGTSWTATALTAVVLQPGQYYLIQENNGSGGTTPLPTPDATGTISMSGSNGKVLLAKSTTEPDGTACPSGADIADLVGYGSANCPTPAGALSGVNAAIRKMGGCTNTGNNSADFDVAPAAPRNTATATAQCAGGGIPSISVADISLDEGNTATTPFEFTVSLSEAAPVGGVSFSYATADGTAIAGTDYDADSGSGSIAESETTTTITINVIGNTTPQSDRSFSLNLTGITGALPTSLSATATIEDDDIGTYAIHDIQGAGNSSPLEGQRVNTQGNIVTAIGPAGFFMQAADADADASVMTSEGIYVYTFSAPAVAVGDKVDLTANVVEYFGLTELNGVSNLVIVSPGNSLPTAVVFDANTPSQDLLTLSCGTTNFECFEGMLVQIDNGIVARANPSFNSDPYAQIFVSASGTRSLRTPGLLYPLVPGVDNPNADLFNGNPHIFEIDTDALGTVPANTAITGGSRFSATGVVAYNFGDYEVWPTSFTVTEANPIPRPVKAGQLGAELRIGSFNMLRFCDTLANTTFTCGNGGEPDAGELALKVSRLSDYVGNVLELPDVLGVVEVENIAVLQMLADQISTDFSVTYTAYLEEGNDGGGIDVGYLVRGDRVSNVAITQLDKDEMWTDPRDGQPHNLHDRPALKLEATFDGQAFATIVIHPKSRSCVDAPSGSNCTQADVDRNRLKRFTQGKSIAMRVQEEQNAQPGRPLLVIGDFNDYQFSDGLVHLTGLIEGRYDDTKNVLHLDGPNIVDPPLWDAVNSLPANEQYSFLYTEQFGEILGYTSPSSFDKGRDVPIMQVLDHALLNDAARAWFVDFEYGRADLDAADADANASTTAVGVSDHDGLVVRLATDRIFADSFGGDP